MAEVIKKERMFPLQTSRTAPAGPRQIPWSVAEVAYGEYTRLYGSSQSLERLAERGGFGWCEMDSLHPKWREEVNEINSLREQVAKLQRFKDYVHSRLDAAGVPTDPESSHKAEGCRIGGRLDVLIGERDRLRECVGKIDVGGIIESVNEIASFYGDAGDQYGLPVHDKRAWCEIRDAIWTDIRRPFIAAELLAAIEPKTEGE
ncbi:hypothetical protein VT84_13910 [Gemmata sp. SH-PL17]|uniref:hypothetical protein n=1 Tax=Gemmata sp. SH-PL17 TaxID=1630693 RepID=UPI00078ECB13|nr:hypothetical protein [Gemmata sp. SH-PL17]AMV25489.1 hypothetical protein VT84_13910 [Gemmata sp. SH-PL17]